PIWLAVFADAGEVEDAVRQRRLPVVDVRDDAEVSDPLGVRKRLDGVVLLLGAHAVLHDSPSSHFSPARCGGKSLSKPYYVPRIVHYRRASFPTPRQPVAISSALCPCTTSRDRNLSRRTGLAGSPDCSTGTSDTTETWPRGSSC